MTLFQPIRALRAALSLRDFYRAQSRMAAGDRTSAERLLRRAIARSGWIPIQPHILLCRLLAQEGRNEEALAEKSAIDRQLPGLKFSPATREYISYYTYGVIEFDFIKANIKKVRIPDPTLIEQRAVDTSISRHFPLEITYGLVEVPLGTPKDRQP